MPAHTIYLRSLTAADVGALDRELAGARAAANPGLALDLSAAGCPW
ncbi:hypothetical protein J0H58_01490 [bacterium]|nr:hypothetical protein [bacterium]